MCLHPGYKRMRSGPGHADNNWHEGSSVIRAGLRKQKTMPLEITCKNNQGVIVLTIIGSLKSGADVGVFRMVFDGFFEEGQFRLALNLNGLSDLDAAGVATLHYDSRELNKAGGGLALFGLRKTSLEPQIEGKLDGLKTFETEEDAIGSFLPEPGVKAYDVLELVRAMKRERGHSHA